MKRKILAIGFVISLVFSYCLSGLQQPPAHAEESATTDYDQQIRQAEEEKKKAESRLESLEKDLKELEEYLNDLFIKDSIDYNDNIYITNMRQKQSLYDCKNSLMQLLETIDAGMPEDLFTIDMQNAYEQLGLIIGETIEDDIVDKIFKDFCMGK